MKHSFLAILFVLAGFASFSQYSMQTKYFVYLQTEPAQPFYIKIDGQTISANSSGYLILPQLKTGDYKLTVGFPGAKYPEQVYPFTIDSKDKGYLIKDFGAEGWGLFDLQTMAVQKPQAGQNVAAATAPVQNSAPAEQKENVSDFTRVLSKAANDPTLLEKPKPEPVIEKPKQEPAPETVKAPVTNEGGGAPSSTVKQENSIGKAVETSVPVSGRIIKKTAEGTEMVFVDKDENGKSEEINVLIPTKESKAAPVDDQKITPPAHETLLDKPEAKKESFAVEEKPPVKEEPAAVAAIKPTGNCKRVAGDDDFMKLRRSMAAGNNDEEMISEADKAFKEKCYTTAQVKYLSSMFLSNAGKYNFYEAAKGHIADPENFPGLASELRDAFYKDKFNSLINK